MAKKFSTTTKIYFLRVFISTVLACMLFFLGAGQWNITRGWIYYILAAVLTLTSNLIIAHYNPGLLEQRSRIRKGTKLWDKIWLFSFMLFFMYGMPLIAGYEVGRLDRQMAGISLPAGIVLFIISVILATWAMSVNKFFESSVRIQEDRGHHVIQKGPYQYVRHPGYSAIIFWAVGYPMTVGSYMALYIGLILLAALVLRTVLEDLTLQKELKGYSEYTRKVKYRLIPYIW